MTKKFSKMLTLFMLAILIVLSSIPFVSAAEALDTNKKVGFTLSCDKKGYEFEVFQVGTFTTASNPYETKYTSLVPEIADSVLSGDTATIIEELDKIETLPTTAKSIGTFTTTEQSTTKNYANQEQGIYYVRATNYPAGVKSVTNSVFALPYYNNTNGWVYTIPTIDLAKKVNDDVPETHKTITNSTKDNENFTDVSLGDVIDFQIKSSTAGSNQMKLKAYTVGDDMSAGLTLDKDSFKVSLLDKYSKKISDLDVSDYSVNVTSEKDGEHTVFSVSFSEDYLQEADFYSAMYTCITYSATLNKHSIVGAEGNPNTETTLKYTNQNNVSAEIDGNTVYVYTYGAYVDKFNEKAEALQGADFSLYTTKNDAEYAKNAIATGTSDNKGKVYFYNTNNEEIKLQSGKYYIKETKAPAGYNLYTDVIEISVDVSYGDTLTNGTYVTGMPENGYASIEVKNTQTILPQTGGQGALILYIVGGAALVGAITLFIVRRKIKG